ncbi:MAG TPA: DUF4397 domain-containing protein [Gemmatimonadaceae bacterium]
MMYRSIHRLAATAALGLAVACNSSDNNSTNPTPQTARVRVVNLSPGQASAGLYANGNLVGSNVSFGSAGTTCFDVPVGQTLSFRGAGSTTDLTSNASAGLQAGQKYTIVLRGSGAQATSTILSDATLGTATTGNNSLRFFNGTGTAGDVWVTTSGGATTGSPTVSNLGAGVSTTGGTMWTSVPNTATQVRMWNTGTTTGTPRVTTTISSGNLSSSGVGTVFLTESNIAGSTTNASVVAAPCT